MLIENADHTKYVSMASIWEMSIKLRLDKLKLAQPFDVFLDRHLDGNGFEVLSIKRDHVLGLLSLPLYHRDPFDRLLISQSITEAMQLISVDALFDIYDIHRVW
jgi:PIN domain nuclease of toxin-antitoxin system